SMPRKLWSGVAAAAAWRKRPLPVPTSTSSGAPRSNNASAFHGCGKSSNVLRWRLKSSAGSSFRRAWRGILKSDIRKSRVFEAKHIIRFFSPIGTGRRGSEGQQRHEDHAGDEATDVSPEGDRFHRKAPQAEHAGDDLEKEPDSQQHERRQVEYEDKDEK